MSEVVALVGALLPQARACCSAQAGDAQDFLVAVLTVVPAAGGLTLASYFITALLPNSAGFRAGLRQLYRTRTVFPILASTGGTITAAFIAQISIAKDAPVAGYFTAATAFQLGPLLWAAIGVFSRIVLLFDYVSVSRELARDIRASDGQEWGLYEIAVHRTAPPDDQVLTLDVRIVVERLNTALNDPLMPIHELIVAAQSKELASYANTLLERVAAEYGIGWRDQGSSPADWVSDRVVRRAAPPTVLLALSAAQIAIGLSRPGPAVRRMDDLVRRRTRMLMEVLHYLRRLPGNDKIDGVPRDHRRQYVQFELCRFAMLCARAGNAVTLRFGVTTAELHLAQMLTLYAVAEIERDFTSVPRRGTVEPLACFADLVGLAAEAGRAHDATWIREHLAWAISKTDHLRNTFGTHDLTALDQPLGPELAAARTPGAPSRSSTSINNPWVRWDRDTGRTTAITPRASLLAAARRRPRRR